MYHSWGSNRRCLGAELDALQLHCSPGGGDSEMNDSTRGGEINRVHTNNKVTNTINSGKYMKKQAHTTH